MEGVDMKNRYKLAFYDIDGVLSIPRYEINNELKCGGSKKWWSKFCKENNDPYKDCKVSNRVFESVKKNFKQGTICYKDGALPTEKKTHRLACGLYKFTE